MPKTKPAPGPKAAADLLLPEEVAAELRLSKRTILDLLKRGELVGFKAASEWRIERSALSDYLAKQARAAKAGS